jgi:hypothetical protein
MAPLNAFFTAPLSVLRLMGEITSSVHPEFDPSAVCKNFWQSIESARPPLAAPTVYPWLMKSPCGPE